MFDFSLGKLLLLGLIALLVLGPEKLPAAARTAGAMLRRFQRSWDSVRAEVERELEIEDIRQAARKAAAEAEAMQKQTSATLRKMSAELDAVREQTEAVVEDTARAVRGDEATGDAQPEAAPAPAIALDAAAEPGAAEAPAGAGVSADQDEDQPHG